MREIEILFPEPIKLKFKNKQGKEQSFIIEELSTEKISRVCVKIARVTQKIFGDPELKKLLDKSGIENAITGSEIDIKSVIGTLIEIVEDDVFELAGMLVDWDIKANPLPVQVVTKILVYSFEMNKEIMQDFTALGEANKLGRSKT
jgi:hypothetical protein